VNVLKNVLRFSGLGIGVGVTQTHGLRYESRSLAPKNVWANGGGYSISADATNVYVTRLAAGADSVDVAVELWHTYEDAEPLPGGIATSLVPFIMQGVNSAGGGVAIAAGTQTAATGTVIFSNANAISFGLSGSNTLTASVDAIKSLVASTHTATGPTVVFSNGGGVTFGITGQTITASVQTAGGTATGVGISAGTEVATTGAVVFSNSNGLSFGMNASTVTVSYDAIKSLSAGTTRITNNEVVFSNSNSISFGVNGQTITAIANLPSVQKVVNYSATGGETDFSVTMAAAANTNYAVFAQNAGVSNIVAWDLPLGTANRALTAFRAIPSGALASGDVIQFMLYAS
jgi:hypothetical protein